MSIISILAIKTNTSMMFKACSVLLCNRLAHLYNSSSSGKALNSWKSSRITPIFKKGDLSCAEYYKPISLLSLVGKIQERLVHQVLINYLLERNAISSYQFGFCPGCFALEALVSLTQSWHQTMKAGLSSVCFFFFKPCQGLLLHTSSLYCGCSF